MGIACVEAVVNVVMGLGGSGRRVVGSGKRTLWQLRYQSEDIPEIAAYPGNFSHFVGCSGFRRAKEPPVSTVTCRHDRKAETGCFDLRARDQRDSNAGFCGRRTGSLPDFPGQPGLCAVSLNTGCKTTRRFRTDATTELSGRY
jgi:hypothetical protein